MGKINLRNGDKIAVVGAGPSGTFFAKFILYLAGLYNLEIRLTIFDGKDFLKSGPSGCNMCAGIIPKTLVERLERIGIELPSSVVQSRIKGYRLNTKGGSIELSTPAGEKIYTVFRGGGPQYCDSHKKDISFDNFLLEHVKALGAEYVKSAVTDIELQRDGKVALSYGRGDGPKAESFDFTAIACGLNTPLLNKVAGLGFGYLPPKVVNACQVELPLSSEFIRKRFGELIHTYNLYIPNIRFAAIIPKSTHVTATIVGERDVKKADMWQFLMHPAVRDDLPADWQIPLHYCHCHPKIAKAASRSPFTDRLVIIGDASCTRFYKNGLESAFHTARLAAEAAFRAGIDNHSLKKHYFERAKELLITDNIYGRALFKIDKFISNVGLIASAHLALAKVESKGAPETLRWILWNLLTGNSPYRKIFIRLLSPGLQFILALRTLKHLLLYLLPSNRKKFFTRPRLELGPLEEGSRIGIIGGGPSGTACAIALKKLAKERGLDIDVWLYEKRDYLKDLKSCVGVLSPPIRDILKELDIEIPEEMVDQTITEYVLHSDSENIHLTKGKLEEDPTISVNRGDFDFLMLENAKRLGVNIIDEAVNDFNVLRETVLVHTSNTTRSFDVLVGGFGLDEKMLKKAELRLEGYQRPRVLETLLADVPLEQREIEHKFAGTIHAFLPHELRNVEFGAMTPKSGCLMVNIAGMHIAESDMDNFLHLPSIVSIIGSTRIKGGYNKGEFPMSRARNFYGDRVVFIGDASGLVRPYKGKGINTAIETGIWAAETMAENGISKEAFDRYYKKCEELLRDCSYGWKLRMLFRIALYMGWVKPIIAKAGWDYNIYIALYDIVSADKSYSRILREDISLRLLLKLAGIVTRKYLRAFTK